MPLLLLEGSQNLSEWSPHVKKGTMGPERIKFEKLGPNHVESSP